ncbi:MAG: hypothetical protein AB7G28_07175 [Pirellulales bacterium]
MRATLVLALLLAVASVQAAERTWTIAREVYTADGELVAVRGGLVYVKIDGKVEEIPIERLSAADQNYIASLSLAPILPGPEAADGSTSMVQPAVAQQDFAQEEMPLPGPPDAPAQGELELNSPDLAPAYGGTPIRSQAAPQPRTRFDRYGRMISPQQGTAANYVAPWGGARQQSNPNARSGRPSPQQDANERNARSKRDNDDDDRPGILSFRARRLERERATANRSR